MSEDTANRVNDRVASRDFKYYIFDWDDNILHMPTRIHLEKRQPDGTWAPQQVSTSVFSLIRGDTYNYRPPNGNWSEAFAEFQDYVQASENQFLRDAREAITRILSGDEKPAPSFQTFRQTLIEGRLFAIVTARGHAPETLRAGVRLFVDLVLTPAEHAEMMANLRGYRACFDQITAFGTDEEELTYYLGLNHYYAVTSPAFDELLPRAAPGAESAETRKQVAICAFVEHVVRILGRTPEDRLRHAISVGFSDDDPGNVKAVEEYIQTELGRRFPGVKFVVYDTSDR
ncbi:MAG: hypothetical protein ACOYOU_16005, partial [Kiritimatiellia bacterium]